MKSSVDRVVDHPLRDWRVRDAEADRWRVGESGVVVIQRGKKKRRDDFRLRRKNRGVENRQVWICFRKDKKRKKKIQADWRTADGQTEGRSDALRRLDA